MRHEEEELGVGHVHKTGSVVCWQNPALNFLWKEHFRVARETFDYLCDLVRVNLQKQHTRFRDPVSVEEKGLVFHSGDWQQATATEVVVYNLALESQRQKVFVASSNKPFLI